ncbi:mediator of DNA damage checkpoint protein 1 [Acomys russatus]|uniref:mediator of DNA damage checkpoint protein 1 n=1 Tax=Acomys russatus TaxID=60746 RepID=UPI0021E2F77F|nr:mediator of DNA damage checkpoint protein 1 [Acomys russatus]
MESTQVIRWDAEEEAETELSSVSLGYSLEPVGRLRLFSGTHGPERDFPLYLGKNVVGRSPDCSVALPFPSVSKQHAVIEISAWNKAPVLQDCGSLNGTQIVRPPRVLTPGVSHRLRDQELILFADFPCQYRRLDVPPPLVPRRLLVEKTPRVQGGPQTAGVSLAEDSEEEVDSSGRCVANGSRNTSSPSVTVVPESDEEDFSPAPSAPGPSLPFDLGSDTDEEQDQQPGVGVSSLAPRNGAPGEAEQPEAHGMSTGIQLVQAQTTEQKCKDIKIKSEAGNGVALAGSILEKSPTLGEDSDTDVEEETPPVLPVTKQVLGTRDSRAPGEARLQDSPSGSDANVEGKTVPAVPPERSHTAMVINSDTEEEEEEVSGALTLARLKERGIALWSRDPSMEEVKSQPQVLVERSESVSGRDSDTDVEEGLSGEKRKVVPDSPMDVDEAPVITRAESQPPHGPSDVDEDMDMSSPGSHLQGNQSSSAVGDKSAVKVEEEVPPEPSVTPGEKHQVPLEEARETAVEEGSSLAGAGVSRSQQPGAQEAGTEWAAAVSEQEHALEVGVQSRSPAAPMEQVAVDTDNSGSPTLPHREIAQTVKAKDCCDEPEDLCLPATQCFVERESQNPEAVQSLEDEPTQVFPCTLPQEPGPSHLSLETPGPGTLDAPWEVLATQPFCLREQTEASEPQLTAAHPEAHGSHPSLPRAPPGHLVHTELLRIEGREIQTVEKAMGHLSCQTSSAGKASRGDAEPVPQRLLSPVPEASAPPQSLLTSQSQKQPPLSASSPSELQLPEALHSKPSARPRRSSRTAARPTDQPAAPRPTSRGRASRSSTRTPELNVPTDPELQPPTSTEQLVTPNATPEATPHRSSIKTPESLIPTGPELQPPTSTEQSVVPKPTSRGRPRKSTIRTPESIAPTGPELQPLTSTEQPVIPKPRATCGRPSKSSIRTPEPVVPTGPELQPPTSTEQPVTLNLKSQTSRGRPSKFIRTPEPVVPTGPELQPPTSTEQPVTPEPSFQVKTRKSSVRTPEASIPTTPKLQPCTSKEQHAPTPRARGTRGRTRKSCTEESESAGPVAPDFEPPTYTDHLTTSPEATTGQSITLQSSPLNVSSVSTTQPSVPTAQPVPLETVPQGSHQRRRRAARKQGSHTGPVGHKAYSASSELEPQSSASQSSGASEAAESNTTTLEPAISLDQKEVGRRSRLIPKTQPEASQVRKKPSSTTDSPLQKRPARQVPQKTVIKEESPAEEAPVKEEPQERAVTAPGKRKRDHAEDESQGNPNRGRRSKPNQEAAVPKVLFTGVTDSRGERAVLALGGSLASSVNEASHLVTDRIRRTVKFLCALGKGIPILSLNWLYQSRKAGCFLPPDKYLVIDPEQEKNFSFSLRDSLSRARERRLLEGYEIHVTPGVQPPPPQMGEIISCCGGTVLPSMPRSYKPHRVIITCPEDLARCTVPSQLGLPLLSPEFLLTGVLKQEATPEAFVLFKLEMSSN